MPEHQNSRSRRPDPIPHDSELARRANLVRFRPERVVSAVAYHAGPEIAVTTVAGGVGALVIHPAALPVVAALTAVYAAVDRITRRRRVEGPAARTAANTPTSKDQTTTSVDADKTADDHTEGVA